MKEIFFMRHGVTKENELKLVIGSINPSLSDKGKAELYSIKEYVVKPDIIFCSDLKRASETAEILFPNSDIIYLPQLRERDWGVLEGKPLDCLINSEIVRTGDEDILTENGIETPSSLLARADQVMRLINRVQVEKIVVISHDFFINFALRRVLPENMKLERLEHSHYHKIVLDSEEKIVDVTMNKCWSG
jgi:broad specificity phosphatase PhoE